MEGCSNAWVRQANGISVCPTHEALIRGDGAPTRVDARLPPNLVDATHAGLVDPPAPGRPGTAVGSPHVALPVNAAPALAPVPPEESSVGAAAAG